MDTTNRKTAKATQQQQQQHLLEDDLLDEFFDEVELVSAPLSPAASKKNPAVFRKYFHGLVSHPLMIKRNVQNKFQGFLMIIYLSVCFDCCFSFESKHCLIHW